jgi:diacylglycerol kinase (ATP)
MWLIAINPTSGQGRGATMGTKVAGYCASKGIDYEIVTGVSAQSLSTSLKEKISRNRDFIDGIIAVGGDGLAHLILQSGVPANIPIAFIPGGTGNDLVRTLGWSLDEITAYLQRVFETKPVNIDLGLVDGEWFAVVLSSGFDAVVNERANVLKWPKGPMRYNAAMALELPKFKAIHYEIELDDQLISTQAMLIAIGNGSSYGGGMRVCPDANIQDGLFDVMILRPVSIPEFIRVFPKVYSGKHIHHPEVTVYRSRRVRIEADTVAYADGERIGQLPISAECVVGALSTWIP